MAAASNPALLLDADERELAWGDVAFGEVPLDELIRRLTTSVQPAKLLVAASIAHEHAARNEKLLVWTNYLGNVRELANIVERSVIVSRGSTLELGDWFAPGPAPTRTLKESEREQILAALEESGWRVSGPRGAALKLGLKPTTLEARMKRLGITRPA